MTWNARNQTLTFWEGLTGSGWLVDGLNIDLINMAQKKPSAQRDLD